MLMLIYSGLCSLTDWKRKVENISSKKPQFHRDDIYISLVWSLHKFPPKPLAPARDSGCNTLGTETTYWRHSTFQFNNQSRKAKDSNLFDREKFYIDQARQRVHIPEILYLNHFRKPCRASTGRGVERKMGARKMRKRRATQSFSRSINFLSPY